MAWRQPSLGVKRFVVWVAGAGMAHAATPSYQHDVLPVVEQHCLVCHSEQRAGGLDLRSLESVLAGGASGAVIVPGDPGKSLLWMKIASDAMPMGGDSLSLEERNLFREWIEHGQFPKADAQADRLSPAERVRRRAEGVWAFTPPVKADPPAVEHLDQVRTAIDAFLLAKLEQNGLSLNPEAPRETLIRRAYLDLTGLPPTPEETTAFVSDQSTRAYENLVDRLLDSPAYGERWARHWMDVAGYVDGNGYLGDEPRTYTWQYRDWVIRALNADMPYDEFVTLQLAGDQDSGWRPGERPSPEAADKLTATGFLRLTPDGTDNQTIYQIDKQWDALQYVTEVSVKAVMGLSINCMRCHDHKFDPFLQTDYYRMMAMFRPVFDPDNVFPPKDTKWLAANIGSGSWPARFVPKASAPEMDRFLELQKNAPSRRDVFFARQAAQEKWLKAQLEALDEPARGIALAALDTPANDRSDEQTKLIDGYTKQFTATNEQLAGIDPEYGKLKAASDAAEREIQAAKPELIWAAWDVSPHAETHVLERGSFESPGAKVEAGIPVIFDSPRNPFTVPERPDSPDTGLRLAFARWLTSGHHPLTARVIANRVWQYHFGQGIVATPDDFGSQGAPPTHPELLDWLAVSLVEHDWSLKWLHRQIMLSNAYRQSAEVAAAKYMADEPNKLLGRWQPRRLEAEAIRDSMLAVSGRLNRAIYGEHILLCRTEDGNYVPDISGQRLDANGIRGFEFDPEPCEAPKQPLEEARQPNRRSIYLLMRRAAVAGLLKAYDEPLMETNFAVRFRSAVPQQALAALHNPEVLQSAEHLAGLTREEVGDDIVARIRRAIERAYARPAAEQEIALGFREIDKHEDREVGLRLFAQALLGSNEFLYID